MAGLYSYALAVELEENNVPKLKNKLVKYFQSKKSNGGDCEVDYENGSRTAVLRFCREEDRNNVLAKEAHQISLDKGLLKMTVRLPPSGTTPQEAASDKLTETSADAAVNNKPSTTSECTPAAEVQAEAKDGHDETADEAPCSTSAVLGNIPEALTPEFLEMLVENVVKDLDSPSTSQAFMLEVIPVISSAVVTFQSEKETTGFVTGCPQNRTFTKKGLSVRPLEVTNQVVVEDLPNVSEDLLQLYFDNAGLRVENVVFNEVEQSAIITFEDPKAVQKAVNKKHRIKEADLRVFPFYKSLGTALYGKDRPSVKLPAAVTEPIDSAVWTYLNGKQSATDTIHRHMADHFCNVNLSQSTVCLSPVPSLRQQKDAKVIIKGWKDTVKSAFVQSLSKFKSLKLQLEPETWKECEEKIRQMLLNEDVVVVPDEANGVFSVAGHVDHVNRLEQSLCEAVKKVVSRLQREKSTVTQQIKVSQSIFLILCQSGLQSKLLSVYPHLKMSYREDNPDLIINGLSDEIMAASKVILDGVLALYRQNLEMDDYLIDLLKDEQQEELTNALLLSYGINAAFQINANRVQILAVNNRDFKVAEDHLGRLLISQYIEVEDRNVLKKPQWNHLVSQLESANNNPCRRIKIHTTGQQVVVSGHKDDVIRVSSDLQEFLTGNAQVKEAVVVKNNVIVEYIKRLDSSCLKEVDGKVVVSYREDAICLSGSRVDVTECKTLVEELVASVFYECFKVSMPGAKKWFTEQETVNFSTLLGGTGCLVQLVDDTRGGQGGLAHTQVSQPVLQLQTSDGVEIALWKADICSYPAHAIVIAATQDLKLHGGLARALLEAAGPQLQDECDKIINLNGHLRPGDSVITAAGGKLGCKNIIHAMAPNFDGAKTQKVVAQLKKTVRGSLELAEKHGCVSVALSAISRSLGFPLKLCAVTIIEAVKQHCDEKYEDNTINRIHLVENDDSTIQAMEEAVRQEFRNHAAIHSQRAPPLPADSTKPPPVDKAPFDSNCLGQVQTKEGLDITLMKGNIEDAPTEVTVNTVFEELDLKRGAVSNAIFGRAGPALQQLVTAEKTKGNIGDIIVTEGCMLKSMFVFHAVSPHWDNGQGNAQKILSDIFKDCLNKAEDRRLRSISFPAMGTGNLRFPKDLAASLLLDQILEFSSTKQPKHLKRVVIILYSRDSQTIEVFTDEFKKRFSNDSDVSVPTSSGPFSKVVSGSGMYETKMGSVTIQAVVGDITKETTDAIVNSSNETFSLKSGVSKAILDAAGKAVEDECQNANVQANAGMIMTQPGNLGCKKIIHIVGQADPLKINKVVKEALKMCVTNSFTSVSFPAIGTGQGNLQAKQVADAMLDGVIDVLNQNTSSTLQKIRIVIFQQPMLKEFYDSMCQREATDPKAVSWFSSISGITDKVKALLGVSASKPQKGGNFVIDAVKVDPACFHICGDSQARVDDVKQKINKVISQAHIRRPLQDNAIQNFCDADCKRLVDIQKTMSVSIMTECNHNKMSLIIEGLHKDVLNAVGEIQEMLNKVRDEEDLNKKIELVGKIAAWQYLHQGSVYQNVDPKTNYELEQAYESNQPSVKVTIQGQLYTVQIPSGPAIDDQGHSLTIKRTDKLKGEHLPENWDTMPANTSCHTVTINDKTAEHREVKQLFEASCGQKYTITKIERIQNPVLWKTLQIKKHDLEQKKGQSNIERRLFHGTCHNIVATVNKHGFNRSYAGKNATCFGKGTYFAVKASYSAQDTYSRPNQNGEKCMYVCRVLTGDYALGKADMIVPPSKDSSSAEMYDSVVDNMATPKMFVIFHDNQAYPEYLITFK